MRPLSEYPVRDADHVMFGLRHQLQDQNRAISSNSLSATYLSLPADLNDLDFDEELYLELYPDVAECVQAGHFRSGFDHWLIHGKAEGRQRRLVMLDSLQRIADATAEANELGSKLGQSPVVPPTLRGRAGSMFAHAIQRVLFWYTSSLESHAIANRRLLSEQSRLLSALSYAVRSQMEDIQTLQSAVRALQRKANRPLDPNTEPASDSPTGRGVPDVNSRRVADEHLISPDRR